VLRLEKSNMKPPSREARSGRRGIGKVVGGQFIVDTVAPSQRSWAYIDNNKKNLHFLQASKAW
jgi:hypothetical protein